MGSWTWRNLRNKIDFKKSPEELFLDPVRDGGMTFLEPPGFIWRDRTPARIAGFSISDHPEILRRTERFLRYTRQHKTFRRAIEFNTVPVMLEQASFRKSYAMAGGKCLLSGASGFRLMNRYCWENEGTIPSAEDRLVSYFHDRQGADVDIAIPYGAGPLPKDIDFAIQCRNTFNYFHFLTETLSHLCLLDDLDFRGRVFIHHPNAPGKTRPFVFGLIRALFPELADRVILARAPADHARVLSSYNFINSYYHLPPDLVQSVDGLAPSKEMWKGNVATRSSQAVLSMNSLDTCLLSLRSRGLRRIEGQDRAHLPRRFYVARRPDQARPRPVGGEAALIETLKTFGFEVVHFEDYDVLDQVALMAGAEIMVSVHGAGFANMLFANPNALVIELGTLQTAIERWGDFWPLAHASGCRYVTFFADYNTDDPLKDPEFATDGIAAVSLSDRALERLAAFVAASLGHRPHLADAEDLGRLAQQLLQTDQPEAAGALLDDHAEMTVRDSDLLLTKAELHRSRGESGAEMLALHDAWEADPGRWQTLWQILLCARKSDRTEVQHWAMRRLEADFPDRCAALARSRPWLRDLLWN